jgi:hypothetical protein
MRALLADIFPRGEAASLAGVDMKTQMSKIRYA